MSTSKLQRYVSQQLSIHFGQYVIRENIRPDWLNPGNGGNLELDFFIEELNLAIEVQGEQHWMFIPFFHIDKGGYNRQIEYDRYKKSACEQKGIRLVEIFSESEIDNLVREYFTLSKEAKIDLKHFENEFKRSKEKSQQEIIGLQR